VNQAIISDTNWLKQSHLQHFAQPSGIQRNPALRRISVGYNLAPNAIMVAALVTQTRKYSVALPPYFDQS